MFGVLLGTIPVITIGWISYSISSRDIEDKVKEGNMQYLYQTQMRVDQHLKTIEMAAIQFVYSSPVTATLNVQLNPGDFDSVQPLTRGLNHLLTFSGVIGAKIVNMEHDWYLVRDQLRNPGPAAGSGPAGVLWQAYEEPVLVQSVPCLGPHG
jgi:hypothetical protein